MNRQSRFDAGYRKLGAGALGWPRGMTELLSQELHWEFLYRLLSILDSWSLYPSYFKYLEPCTAVPNLLMNEGKKENYLSNKHGFMQIST